MSLTVVRSAETAKSSWVALAPFAGPIVALFAIWAVHNLTKGRDREKAVFDLYKTVGDAASALKPVILKAWSEADAISRRAAIAETKWRLQQIGGFAERIRRQSRRWALRGARTPRPLRGVAYIPARADLPWWHWSSIRAKTSSPFRMVIVWIRHLLWPPGWTVEIGLTTAMAELRDDVTADPFEDPGREANKKMGEAVELAVGSFLQSLDEQLFAWMD